MHSNRKKTSRHANKSARGTKFSKPSTRAGSSRANKARRSLSTTKIVEMVRPLIRGLKPINDDVKTPTSGFHARFGLALTELPKEVQLTRSSARSMLGPDPIVFELGFWSSFSTTAGQHLVFATLGTSSGYEWIPMSAGVSGSTWSSDLASLLTLFDEFKTESFHIKYEPSNPYNRGTSTNTDVVGWFFDDENVTNQGGTSDLAAWGDRSDLVTMSLDHSFEHTFRRPNPLHEYPWAAFAPTTTTVINGWSGTVNLAYNAASLTASTRYGVALGRFRMHCRMRI